MDVNKFLDGVELIAEAIFGKPKKVKCDDCINMSPYKGEGQMVASCKVMYRAMERTDIEIVCHEFKPKEGSSEKTCSDEPATEEA